MLYVGMEVSKRKPFLVGGEWGVARKLNINSQIQIIHFINCCIVLYTMMNQSHCIYHCFDADPKRTDFHGF
jgi:hypothetical protein